VRGPLLAFGLLLAAAGPAAATSQPASCRPGLAEYRALKRGDSLKAVSERLGCPGRRRFGFKIGERRRSVYVWQGAGRFGANIDLTFENGRLSDKSQLGLK
jgi:hypothetical protein